MQINMTEKLSHKEMSKLYFIPKYKKEQILRCVGCVCVCVCVVYACLQWEYLFIKKNSIVIIHS